MDVEAAGLADYGKHGEYVSRQVKTWTRQYEASKTGEIQAMDKVTIRDISDPHCFLGDRLAPSQYPHAKAHERSSWRLQS